MSWPAPATPPADVEALVIGYLDALIPEAVVRPSMVGWSEGLLWVMVTRTGGQTVIRGRAEAVPIDLQAVAPSKPQAWDLASALSVAMLSLPDAVTGVISVTANVGWSHIPMPDTIDGPSRYAAGFTVLASGTPA